MAGLISGMMASDWTGGCRKMSRKAKIAYFILTLLVMGSFAMVGIMISETLYGYAVLFLVLALLLAGGGFSLKKRFMKQE
jgi:hypothetical protein